MKTLVKLSNINKSYFSDNGVIEVLKNISFEIKENQIIAILGPSGCGKSTILNILSSLEKETSGEINSNCQFGYMFQKDNLLEWRTILNNVLLGLEIKHQKTAENIKYLNK